MAYPIPRTAIPDTELLARGPQKQMVVRIAEVGLEEVVIHVLRGKLGPHARHVHGLELQHHHSARGVLGEGLVDAQRDLRARPHLAINQMAFNELLRHVLPHCSSISVQPAAFVWYSLRSRLIAGRPPACQGCRDYSLDCHGGAVLLKNDAMPARQSSVARACAFISTAC